MVRGGEPHDRESSSELSQWTRTRPGSADPIDVALLAQMGQRRVKKTGFRATHLHSDPLLISSVALD